MAQNNLEIAKQEILAVMKKYGIISIHSDNFGCTVIVNQDDPPLELFDDEEEEEGE